MRPLRVLHGLVLLVLLASTGCTAADAAEMSNFLASWLRQLLAVWLL